MPPCSDTNTGAIVLGYPAAYAFKRAWALPALRQRSVEAYRGGSYRVVPTRRPCRERLPERPARPVKIARRVYLAGLASCLELRMELGFVMPGTPLAWK